MKIIVTHHTPDLDAIAATWLTLRFLPEWSGAQVKFIPAGTTFKNMIVDSDPDILHIDLGEGTLDHHQTSEKTCAAKLAYKYIRKKKDKKGQWKDEALARICDVVCFYDHFLEVNLPDIKADYHIFDAVNIIDGLKQKYIEQDEKILEIGLEMMDAVYKMMKDKIWAEEILENEAIHFESPWGKAVAFETINDDVLRLAQKSGYVIALRKDPKKDYVRIKARPGTKVDLTKTYEALQKKDRQATWFLHASKKMLLNGTTKSPDMRPTSLDLHEIVEILKKN